MWRSLIVGVVLLAATPAVALVEEPMCAPPLGASPAWLAAQDPGERFEVPGHAEWTEGYPNYGTALGYLERFAAQDALGVFTDHQRRTIVMVVDRALPQVELQALVSDIRAGYPEGAPPADVVRSCFPLEQTRRAVGLLISGTWHESLTQSSTTGGTWSVVAWPVLGGAVEVWVAAAPLGLEAELEELLGADAGLLRLVVGEVLLVEHKPGTTTRTTVFPVSTDPVGTKPENPIGERTGVGPDDEPAAVGVLGAVAVGALVVVGLLQAGRLLARNGHE